MGRTAVQQPVVQFGAANRVADRFDAVADLGERDRAQEQILKSLARDEALHPAHWGAVGAVPKSRWYRAASHSQLDRPHGHGTAPWLDLNLAMWRSLQGINQQLAGSAALQALKFVSGDHHHRIAAVRRHVLGSIAVCQAHEFAEPRLGVLKAPATARGLPGWRGQGRTVCDR